MRNLLALSALLCLAASRPTPACGFYMPRVFLTSTHYIPHGAPNEVTFALTDHRDVPDDGWALLAPMSYDSTMVIDAKESPPLQLTLLGPADKSVVQAKHRMFIKGGEHPTPMGAYVVDTGGRHFDIAVSGSHIDMAFDRLELIAFTPKDAAWLADNKLAWESATVEHIGNVDTLSAWADGATRTVVRREGQLVGTYDGRPVGRLGADGMEYLLIEHDGDVRSIML